MKYNVYLLKSFTFFTLLKKNVLNVLFAVTSNNMCGHTSYMPNINFCAYRQIYTDYFGCQKKTVMLKNQTIIIDRL